MNKLDEYQSLTKTHARAAVSTGWRVQHAQTLFAPLPVKMARTRASLKRTAPMVGRAHQLTTLQKFVFGLRRFSRCVRCSDPACGLYPSPGLVREPEDAHRKSFQEKLTQWLIVELSPANLSWRHRGSVSTSTRRLIPTGRRRGNVSRSFQGESLDSTFSPQGGGRFCPASNKFAAHEVDEL